MEPLINQHIKEVHEHNHGHTEEWLMKEHKNRFTSWLMEQDIPNGETLEEHTIKVLASGPSCKVRTWQTYDISGFTLYQVQGPKEHGTKQWGFDVMP
jgi:hypothetical protein